MKKVYFWVLLIIALIILSVFVLYKLGYLSKDKLSSKCFYEEREAICNQLIVGLRTDITAEEKINIEKIIKENGGQIVDRSIDSTNFWGNEILLVEMNKEESLIGLNDLFKNVPGIQVVDYNFSDMKALQD